jgi:transposase-like protein
VSESSITRLTTQWQDEARAFAARDLSGVGYVYLWADGIHLKIRLEQEKLCLLVMIGVCAYGRRELVALTDGFRESHESWADLLRDCRRRGMRAPILAVGDGALGFWKSLREVFPQTKEQRCWFHKQANTRAALPKSAHPGAQAAMKEIYNAEDADKARAAITVFGTRLRREVPEGRGEDRRRRRRAAGVLPLPGRALDLSAHDEPHRIYFRDSAFEEQGHQGAGPADGRARDGVQADRGR